MDIYCTYLTIYFGNKLPNFYIGSTSIDNIESGYRGSVLSKKYKKIWQLELKLNPHLFKTKIITTHPTREDATSKELKFQKQLNVVNSSMYINEALASPSGYFGRRLEKENHPSYGRKRQHSEESKLKMKLAKIGTNRGDKNPMYGKFHTTEWKINHSKKLTGANHFNYGKPAFNKGTVWMNNGDKSKMIPNQEVTNLINDGWSMGRIRIKK